MDVADAKRFAQSWVADENTLCEPIPCMKPSAKIGCRILKPAAVPTYMEIACGDTARSVTAGDLHVCGYGSWFQYSASDLCRRLHAGYRFAQCVFIGNPGLCESLCIRHVHVRLSVFSAVSRPGSHQLSVHRRYQSCRVQVDVSPGGPPG